MLFFQENFKGAQAEFFYIIHVCMGRWPNNYPKKLKLFWLGPVIRYFFRENLC